MFDEIFTRSRALQPPPLTVCRRHAALLVLAFVAACGPSEIEITPATVDGDRLLFERGDTSLGEEDWVRAREYFLQVRDNYPQSEYRAEARLGVADSYEGQGGAEAYVSALAEYQDFLRLYPTHPRADYAQFKLGQVYQHQMRGPERDQSWTRSAIREYERFIELYPTSALIADVRTSLREARDRLSESELLVGRYYYRAGWWPGAIERLNVIMDTDPDFTGRAEVYFTLGDALYESGELEEALPLFQRLLEEFPDSEFVEGVPEAIADIETRLSEAPTQTATSGDASEDDSSSPPQNDGTL